MDQTPAKQKLLDQARAALREKRYSIHTEHAYVDWMRRFILFHDKRHPHERSLDPRSGLVRRHRLGESGPQKAVRQAALSSGIPKRITCRAFRDAFAAHLLESSLRHKRGFTLMCHCQINLTMAHSTFGGLVPGQGPPGHKVPRLPSFRPVNGAPEPDSSGAAP